MNRWFIASSMFVMSLVAGVWVSYDFNYQQILEREQRALSSALEAERLLFQAKLDKYASDITILQSIPPVKAIIQAKSDSQNSEVLTIWKSRLKSIFKSYLTANEMAFQLRYIGFDENGKEIVNVKKEAGVAQVIPERLLQEKSGRDYFSEIRLNQFSGVYISDISLNRDFDSISIPYNPTVRIAAKVMASDGVPFGFIVINVSANAIFKELISKVPKNASLYITNDKGEVLYYPDESLNFAFEHVDVPVWDELYSESQEMFVLNDGTKITSVNPSRSIIAKVNLPLTSGLNSLNIILKKDVDDIRLKAMSATFFSVGWVFVIFVGLIFVIFSFRKSLKAQAALSIEKTEKSMIVESSQDAILGVSIDGTITEWNNSATKMFGLSRHEVIGEFTRDVFLTDSVQTEDEYIVSQFVKGYKVKPFETKRQTKRSQVFDVSVSASPICDEHGELIGFSKIMRDITEQKRVSNELELLNASLEKEVQQRTVELNKSYSLQAAIMDKAAIAIIATNAQGYITLFNPAAEKLLGYSAEELIGKQTPGLFHLESEVVARAIELSNELGQKIEPGFDVFVAKTLAGLRNEREWTYVSKTGHKIPVYLSITALYDENDEVSGFLGMATNISELSSSRKKLEVLKD
ncbi:PAS domain-containing protein [Marinomonas gallaica]|uniref:PAS domain-containing protein n=1 Tax=Marinomonas gallaica TaxID=1806667 RepID=UPI00082F8599|nr:PAS domain S-box protein [Marinomonas gallaica]